MKVIPYYELSEYNFSVEVLHVLKQVWNDEHIYSCLNNPKNANLFMYLDNCEAEYTDNFGNVFFAKSKSLIYIPDGYGYKIKLTPYGAGTTIGIKFSMVDEKGEKFILSDKIKVFDKEDFKDYVYSIESAIKGSNFFYARIKSDIYNILAKISEDRKIPEKYRIIKDGIDALEKDIMSDLTISDIAKMCNISEIYFRRLFKEYSGFSPMEYRMKSRIEIAKKHIEYDEFSIFEIAELSGFKDTSYFCRQFKKYTGITPTEYRKK